VAGGARTLKPAVGPGVAVIRCPREGSRQVQWPMPCARRRGPTLGSLAGLALCVGPAPAIAMAAAIAVVHTVTANVVHVLARSLPGARRGGVPVLLPAHYTIDVARVYGSGGAVPGGYALSLAAAPACHDATACFLAAFSGVRGATLGAGASVALTHGLSGRYRALSCGASCSPGSVSWVQHGVTYEIQANVIGPERGALVRLADAAISAGPR